MTTNQGQNNEVQPTTDDVDGHRISGFVEDYKDAAMGLRRSAGDSADRKVTPFTDDAEDDVEGHLRVPFTDDETDNDVDVEGHLRVPFTDDETESDVEGHLRVPFTDDETDNDIEGHRIRS